LNVVPPAVDVLGDKRDGALDVGEDLGDGLRDFADFDCPADGKRRSG